jgi:hypothetical protein
MDQRCTHPFGRGPSPESAPGEADFVQHRPDLGQVALVGGFVQVRCKGLQDFCFALDNRLPENSQRPAAEAEPAGDARFKESPLFFDDVGNSFDDVAFPSERYSDKRSIRYRNTLSVVKRLLCRSFS